MKNIINIFAVLTISHFFSFNTLAFTQLELSNAKERMIQESINSYPSNCPCPYNTMRNGRSCGGRSAYSKPGGYAPLCYVKDVSDREAEKYLKRNNR